MTRTAAEILIDVAARHAITADELTKRTKRRIVVAAKTDALRRLTQELGWPVSRAGQRLGMARQTAYSRLRQIETQCAQIETQSPPLARIAVEDVEVLRHRVATLTGLSVRHSVAAKLECPLWIATFLAILIEAHPGAITQDMLAHRYETACEIDDGKDVEATGELMRSFAYRLRKMCAAAGLPDPLLTPHGGYVLADDFARWCKFNIPGER